MIAEASRRGWLLAGLILLGPGCRPPEGPYPDRPIKVIVPFSPGGSTDAFARLAKNAVEQLELLPQPLVVVNIEGAGSTIGSRRAKNARPDGYTLLLLNDAIVTAKYWGVASYGPEAFEPLVGTGQFGTVITVRDDAPFDSLGDLLQQAAARPNQIRAAVALGTPSHFACLQVQGAEPGARFAYAQVGGGAHRFTSIKGGHADVTTFSTDEFRRFRSEGLKGLAYLGPQRHPAIPNIPTAHEQGYDVERSIMLYWWAPRGTPPTRLKIVADALQQAMETPAVQQFMREQTIEPVVLRGSELQAKLRRTEEDVARIDPRREVVLPSMQWIVLGVVAALLIGALWESRRAVGEPAPAAAVDAAVETAVETAGSGRRGLAALAATVGFAGLLGRIPVAAAVGSFVLVCGAVIAGRQTPRQWAALAALAASLAASLHVLFTRVFPVDFGT